MVLCIIVVYIRSTTIKHSYKHRRFEMTFYNYYDFIKYNMCWRVAKNYSNSFQNPKSGFREKFGFQTVTNADFSPNINSRTRCIVISLDFFSPILFLYSAIEKRVVFTYMGISNILLL